MNLNQLVYFAAVGKNGSYSRAAEELGVSQPVVYKSVRGLQKECGIQLLGRQGKGVCLTKAGRAVFNYATQAASLKNLAEQAVAEEKGPMSGHISIGSGTHVGCYLLPNILSGWLLEHPRVTISITYGQHQQMNDLLLQDRLDFLLASSSRWAPGLQTRLIFSDTVVVVAPPGHRFERPGVVSIKELSSEPLVVPSRGSSTREAIEQIEHRHGVSFRVAVEANRQDMLKQMCRAGVGIAIIPKSIVSEEVANKQLSLLRVEGFPINRPYFLVQRTGKVLTPEMRSLLAAVETWVQERDKG